VLMEREGIFNSYEVKVECFLLMNPAVVLMTK
jgi:hypothetical protein